MIIETEMISSYVLESRVPFSVRTSQHVKNQSSCEEYGKNFSTCEKSVLM